MNRFIDFTKRNIRRTPYQAIAATMIMFLTFLTIIVFSLLVTGSQRILKYYESKPQAIAFFKDNTSDADIQAIEKALNDTGRVTNINYVTKEEALKIYQERNKNDPLLLELVTAQILPASIEISTNDLSDLGPIKAILEKEPVIGPGNVIVPEDVIQTLAKTITAIRLTGSLVAGFLLIFSFTILLMIIGFKIRLRRNEIEIMKLLGASTWFIRAPFILEGMTYGAVGAFLAWVLTYVVIWYISPILQSKLSDLPASVITLPIPWTIMLLVLAIALLLSAVIGGLGSYAAVRRYLRI
jgi:cell division transport system permease protein